MVDYNSLLDSVSGEHMKGVMLNNSREDSYQTPMELGKCASGNCAGNCYGNCKGIKFDEVIELGKCASGNCQGNCYGNCKGIELASEVALVEMGKCASGNCAGNCYGNCKGIKFEDVVEEQTRKYLN